MARTTAPDGGTTLWDSRSALPSTHCARSMSTPLPFPYVCALLQSLAHSEPPGLQPRVAHVHPHTSSQRTPARNCCSDSPPSRSASTVSLTRCSAFRVSPLRTQGSRTKADSADAGREQGKPLLVPGGDRRVSLRRKTMARQGSVPDQVHNTVATDTRIIVFDDGWSHTQSMPTTPTHVASESAFPFSPDTHVPLTSSDALSSSTRQSDVLHASGISINCSSASPSCSESNLDHPFMTRAPSRDRQEHSPDYFDRLEVMSCTDTASCTSTRDSSEDYFDRLEPTLKDYFDHLEAPVIPMSRDNWDKASFLKQRARSHTQGAPPPKPSRGPTPAPIAEAIETWNSELRRSRVMRITATPERQSAPINDSNKPSGRSTLHRGLRGILRLSHQEKGTKTQPRASAPRHCKTSHSEGCTSLSDLSTSLPSSAQQQRKSSSLTNLKVCRVQKQPSAGPPCLPHPPHDRISQTSVDSNLFQHLFPDGKIQRLRKRTSDTAEHFDEEHLRLTVEEVQALYAATLGPVLCRGRTTHPQALPGPPLLPPRSDSLHTPQPESDQLRETLLTILLEPSLDDPHFSPLSMIQSGCGRMPTGCGRSPDRQ